MPKHRTGADRCEAPKNANLWILDMSLNDLNEAPLTADRFDELHAPQCPISFYRDLNSLGGIAHDPTTGNYVVTGYDLIRKITADPASFSSNTGLAIERHTPIQERVREMYEARAWPAKHVLLTNDPPDHRSFRALVDRVWSPARVTALHQYMKDLIEDSIDRFIDRGEVEFISEFAATFPVIIAIDFLGLPRTDAQRVLAWTRAASSINDNRYDEETELAAHEQMIELLQYIKTAGDEVAATPSDSFLSALKHAELNGKRLTEQEFVWLVLLLVVGGHDSITLAIGSAMVLFIERPELARSLASDPIRIKDFVEELLRTQGPVKATHRRATLDTRIGGVDIPRGSIIQLQWAGANYDAARFAAPETFDLDRENVRRHMSFGSGIHLCIGNQLARAEITIALETILKRMSNFRYAERLEPVKFRSDYVQQGPTELLMQFDKVKIAN